MIILLIGYFLFLLVYLIFNTYGMMKVWKMRMPKDKTPIGIMIYLISIGAILLVSATLILTLDWNL